MLTLSAGQAQTVRDYLLPQIEANRQFVRIAIAQVPANQLDARPVEGGETLGDLLWYIASAFDVFLSGICDGKFPELPAKPVPASTAAFLAWDEERFAVLLQRAALLDGDALLKPITFGHLTRPAVDFIPVFLTNIAQHIGMLSAWMQLYTQPVAVATRPVAAEDGELSDDELASVAGGASGSADTQYVVLPSGSTAGTNPNIKMTVTYNTPSPILIQTQAGLGSLLGDGGGGLGAVGAVGGIAMIAGIWGAGIAGLMSGVGVGATAASAGYTAGMAIIGFLSRF